jgi:hypothetical protein
MTKQQVLDLYFLDARHRLIELAAFLDRADRSDGKDDFRLKAFRTALGKLTGIKKEKAKSVLLAFSDLTIKPIARAEGKSAVGAFPKKNDPRITRIKQIKFSSFSAQSVKSADKIKL